MPYVRLTKMVAALRKRFNGDAKRSAKLMNNTDVTARANGNGYRK